MTLLKRINNRSLPKHSTKLKNTDFYELYLFSMQSFNLLLQKYQVSEFFLLVVKCQ